MGATSRGNPAVAAMVFEGILADVLNRFLGPYVKNLDASQLRVGIWGGGQKMEQSAAVHRLMFITSRILQSARIFHFEVHIKLAKDEHKDQLVN